MFILPVRSLFFRKLLELFTNFHEISYVTTLVATCALCRLLSCQCDGLTTSITWYRATNFCDYICVHTKNIPLLWRCLFLRVWNKNMAATRIHYLHLWWWQVMNIRGVHVHFRKGIYNKWKMIHNPLYGYVINSRCWNSALHRSPLLLHPLQLFIIIFNYMESG